MTRFNYLATTPSHNFRARFGTVAIDNAVRGPLAALFATLFLTTTLCVAQLTRLHAAQNAYVAASMRLSADTAGLAEVTALRTRVMDKMHLTGRVASMRRADVEHASELIWIGNHLPSQAWLAALRYEAGTYALEGCADGASAVGSMMLALHDASHATIPQLVSLRANVSNATPCVQYSLRLQVQR